MDEKLKAFWAKLNSDIADLWEKDKLFLIIFGVLILVIKFRSILIDLIISNSKTIFNDAKKEDANLKQQEDQANQAADQLVKHAEEIGKNEGTVTDDWNTKK